MLSSMCSILFFLSHSFILPSPSSSLILQTTVSLPFSFPNGSTFFYHFQFFSNLYQYLLLYSLSNYPNNLLAAYQPGNPPLQLSQMATYLFVMGEFEYSKAQKSEVKTVAKDVVKSEV